jgi:DNA-binding NtrC family response regulator
LLLVECDPVREKLDPGFESAGWSVTHVRTPAETRKALRRASYPVIVVCFGRRRRLDLPALQQCLDMAPESQWVAVLSRDLLADTHLRDLIYEHFYDYHTMPVGPERLLATLGHACGMVALRPVRQHVMAAGEDHQIVGTSRAMHTVMASLNKVSRVDVPVLITGESGTGKELMAQAVHRGSDRHDGPFVAVNCAALPPGLIQSELFGHERGAFTGALRQHIGRIEAAQGGTVLLDEIGELSLDLQVNLLRFLQEGTIERVGGKESLSVDARILAATNIDLEEAVAEGKFREDLYYRLNVLRLHLPPLRERVEDIEALAHFFFERFNADKNRQVEGFSQQAVAAMRAHDWPGNVRELINRVRQAMIMSERRLIRPDDLGLGLPEAMDRQVVSLEEARDGAEREAIIDNLQHAGFNVSKAARQLGVSRITLYRLMKKHGISPDGLDAE